MLTKNGTPSLTYGKVCVLCRCFRFEMVSKEVNVTMVSNRLNRHT